MAMSDMVELQKAVDSLTKVAHRMLIDKDKLDMEFLSDLSQILSDLQKLVDELTERGWGKIEACEDTPDEVKDAVYKFAETWETLIKEANENQKSELYKKYSIFLKEINKIKK